MPFGVELWIRCVITMVRNLKSGATVGGDGEVGGTKTKKKRPPCRKYTGKDRACCETNFKDLQATYNIPASKIWGYFNKDSSGQKAVVPLVMGQKCVLAPQDEQKLVDYLLKCCDRGYGKNRG